jgi:DNA polymerase III delta prime subunit
MGMEKNFFSRVRPTSTSFDNYFLQGKTVFKNASQKLCYMYLYSFATAHETFPSMDTIAEAICGKKRNAIQVIQQLENMQFLKVVRTKGKSNLYYLMDYYEVEAHLTSAKNAPVQKMHQNQCKNDTSAKNAPVQKMHPITSTSSFSSFSKLLVSSDKLIIIDKKLKEEFPDRPFDRIQKKLIKDANDGKVDIAHENSYEALLRYRLERSKLRTSAQTGQIRTKAPIRTENTPEWYKEPEEYYKSLENEKEKPNDDVAAKKKEIEKMLKEIDE